MNLSDFRQKTNHYLRSYAMIIALIVICIAFQMITKGTFLSIRNLSNLFRQTAVVGVLSIGMTLCLIAGNFDLSVGAVTGFLGAMAAYLVTNAHLDNGVAVLLTLLLGGVIGCWNGMWIAYAQVPAFIVTLGSSLIFKGALFIVTQGTTIPVRDSLFMLLGQSYLTAATGYVFCALALALFIGMDARSKAAYRRIFPERTISIRKQVGVYIFVGLLLGVFSFVMNLYEGIPVAVFLLLCLVALFSFILSKTRFGRKLYAVGGNPSAARLSGINNANVTLIAFVVMGILAGVAGVLTTARLAAATPGAALGMELDAVASSVIGGVSLAGGRGKVSNSLIGALVMASLTNGMSLLNINSDIQYIVKGLILILAVWFDVRMRVASSKQ